MACNNLHHAAAQGVLIVVWRAFRIGVQRRSRIVAKNVAVIFFTALIRLLFIQILQPSRRASDLMRQRVAVDFGSHRRGSMPEHLGDRREIFPFRQ